MKKSAITAIFCLFTASAQAQMPYLEEMEALGAVSGQGLACGSSRYDDFEMLARAIMVTKAPGDAMQARGMEAYNEKKAIAYMSKQMDGYYECRQINRMFDSQGIFNITLYADGTIKMPDGKILTPRQPYDVTLVYDSKNNIAAEAKAIYESNGNQEVEITVKDTTEKVIRPAYEPEPASAPQPLESSIKRVSNPKRY